MESLRHNKKIIIWTEGGKKIGFGHIRRCLVIAKELRKEDMNVLFFINKDPLAIDWIKKEGFSYEVAEFSELKIPNSKVALMDTKKPIAELIKKAKLSDCKTILMDNITDARMQADIVIYPAVIFDETLNWNRFKGKILKGVDYIPIADSYIKARERAQHKELKPPYNVLVTMGGSDPNQLTYKIVSSLLELIDSIKIRVVIGPAFRYDERLDKIERQKYHNVEFIKGIKDLSLLMAESHIAVTALGTTIYELACMEVPSIIIANYRTDEMDMEAFRKLGISLPLGYYEDVSDAAIRQAVEMLLKDSRLWGNMSQKGKMIVDGKGAERIAAVVEKLLVKSL